MNKELAEQLDHNEKTIQDEINWINEMLRRLRESRKYIEKTHKNKYYINQFLKVYDNLIPFFEIRLKELGVSSQNVQSTSKTGVKK